MTNWIIKTANYTAQPKDKIIGDTRNAVFTVTLPPSPSNNIEVKFVRIGSYILNIDFNGSKYNGATPLVGQIYINVANEEVSLVYVDANLGWIPNRNNILLDNSTVTT